MLRADPALEAAARILTGVKTFDGYATDPVAWVHDHIDFPPGEGPAGYQDDALAAMIEHGRVCVRAPRGGGKTAPAAWVVLWFGETRDGEDWKVPTTAGSWLQLQRFLWPEVHKWAGRLRWDLLGRRPYAPRELQTMALKLRTGWAAAINAEKSDLLEGAHARHLLAVIDEGKSVPAASWDAIEGYFSDPGERYALALSIPGPPAGRFYEIHARAPGLEDWLPVHITRQQAIDAGRLSEEWAQQRARQWGRESTLYRTHVEAEFGGSSDGVIPVDWIEQAVDRWRAYRDDGILEHLEIDRTAVDVADEGEADTVIARRSGKVLVELRYYPSGDTMQTVARTEAATPAGVEAVVDSIGVGAGVLARLRELELPATGFVASERSSRLDATGEFGFTNRRAEAWWHLRELLDPANGEEIALPDDPRLMGDLAAPTWREISGAPAKIQIETKDKIRERIGRSTDAGDAAVMAFSPIPEVAVAFRDDARAIREAVTAERRSVLGLRGR